MLRSIDQAAEVQAQATTSGVFAHVRWLQIGVLSGLILFLSTQLLLQQGPVYQSPDETSNHIFTQTFGDTGKLWYEHELLPQDSENLLHPRGVLTHDDRAVPFNFLGLPVLYGGLYRVVGEHVQYIAILFAAATAFFIYRAAVELFDVALEDALAALIVATPLLYYFNRPYMNALPAIAFFALGVWMLARYAKRGSNTSFALAALAFACAMLFRYEYVLFCTPLLAIVAYQREGAIGWLLVRRLAIAAAVVGGVFILPVLAMNQFVYGHWRTYGYGLFNDVYYPEKSSDSGGLLTSTAASVVSVFVPSDIQLDVVARNLVRFTILQAPMLTLVALVGGWFTYSQNGLRLRTLALWTLLLALFLCYRGSSDTWASRGMAPDFDAAVMRYWLPMYVGLALLAAYALSTITDRVLKLVLVCVMAATGVVTLGWQYDGNLSGISDTLAREERWSHQTLIPTTESNAVVFSGRSDKRVVPYRFSAAWWNGEEFYNPHEIAASMNLVRNAGYPVYVIRESEVDIDELNVALRAFGLTAARTNAGAIFHIEPLVREDDP